MLNQIVEGDCLEVMREIPDGSIDMILCDLPYGTTRNKWDSVVALETLWAHYTRILKGGSAVVLTAVQPFTSSLIMSNPEWYRHSYVWEKNVASNFLNAKREPLRIHEEVLVFGERGVRYRPQMRSGEPYTNRRGKDDTGSNYGEVSRRTDTVNKGERYPQTVLRFAREIGLHPTQKPVPLFEFLIRTYTDEGAVVLDNCAGSGTTAIAALRAGRNFICIEREPEYVQIARERVSQELAEAA